MGSVSAWEKQSEACGGAVTNDPGGLPYILCGQRQGRKPEQAVASPLPLPPAVSPSQTHPRGIPPC